MKPEWKITEEHLFECHGKPHRTLRIVAVCPDCESAKRALSQAFDERWNEHTFPPDQWISECVPPEDSPENARFASKFVDEGEFKFSIERLTAE